MNKFTTALLLLLSAFATNASADYADWKHSGSMFILTTPDGASLDAKASVDGFPLLVRLHKDFFDFSQAKGGGADIRFSLADGTGLAYQIEAWDGVTGTASIWVRVPHIKGNDRQELKLYWGKPDAASESNGAAVFGASNGYVSVWHMSGPVKDEVGTVQSKDVGTTDVAGIIGQARHLAGKEGIFCGEKIGGYPTGAGSHSSEAWFRAERSNVTILAWGNEEGGRGSKVRMQFRSPPHVKIDSNFSDVKTDKPLKFAEWIHVVHTYDRADGKLYINGEPAGAATPILNIKSPARCWIGGWYNNYDFEGDIDEVRISSVARSAAWVKLEYENQKPLQTLVGPIVQSGDAFSVSPKEVTVAEGKNATITAIAGGAQKLFWTLKRNGQETIVGTDRFAMTFDAGRVNGDQKATLQLKAVYAKSVKTIDIPLTIKETIPEPIFQLQAPATWDGRSTIEIVPQLKNADAMKAGGGGPLLYDWEITGFGVIKSVEPGKLVLQRAMNSGKLTVTAIATNGGQPISQSIDIAVTEPATDPWVARIPAKDEKPQENQFYARDDKNVGTLVYNGMLADAADMVFLKVYAEDKLIDTQTAKPAADHSYSLTAKLKPGLIHYKVQFGTKTGDAEKVLDTVGNLVCGDAYLIDGQSNAEAVAWGKEDYTFSSQWLRSFGSPDTDAKGARMNVWAEASARSKGGKAQVGYWGMELGRRLLESQKLPICIINGAVGGTRVDQHQRSAADPEDVTTIYGRLRWRVRQAKLTHGIRGILWHQGENDQGADGPTGGYGYETYRQLFLDMAAGWKSDYPNVQHYYVFQIWPKSCAMGINGSDNKLREVQRELVTGFSNLSVMSTLGIDPPGGCHYPPAGYAEFARLICPLIERDHYGKTFQTSITPPNLVKAGYTQGKQDEIVIEFDQPVKWDNALAGQFYLDGESGKVVSGTVAGHVVTLKLNSESKARTITYLDSKAWSQQTLLRGLNGIAALTFCDVPLASSK